MIGIAWYKHPCNHRDMSLDGELLCEVGREASEDCFDRNSCPDYLAEPEESVV